MTAALPYKIGLFAHKKRFADIANDVRSDADYGIVWDAFGKDERESCYVVRFVGKTTAQILGFVDVNGHVYRVNAPLFGAELPEDPDIVLCLDGPDAPSGIIARCVDGETRPISAYEGKPEGNLRECVPAGVQTWNSARELPYGEFLGSLFVRYVILGEQAPGLTGKAAEELESANESSSEDNTFMRMHPLDTPVKIFAGFDSAPLPDAIDTLLFRIGEKEDPCGAERYAARLLGELDLDLLRRVSVKTELTLARIEHGGYFYINFDRQDLTLDEVEVVLACEATLNRLSYLLDRLDAGVSRELTTSPSEKDCSRTDMRSLYALTAQVDTVLKLQGEPNPWACPGSRPCTLAGEWDVRTRFAHAAERLSMVVRLDYRFDVDAARGTVFVRFAAPAVSAMPRSIYDVKGHDWHTLDAGERLAFRDELVARMTVVLAAACFASGLFIKRCVVQVDALVAAGEKPEPLRASRFERIEFMARWVDAARDAVGLPFAGSPTHRALEGCAIDLETELPIMDPERGLPPRDDERTLPAELRPLLLADDARELEVIEASDDPNAERLARLRELEQTDPQAAAAGVVRLIEELEAECVVAELTATSPVEMQFCENYQARLLMSLVESDPQVRILRVPDALYFAQYQLCNMYARTGDYEAALPEARKLYDMAKTSMQAHYTLINVLANLERYDEVAEVARHGLRLACERDSVAYLFYRLAFATWNLGDRPTALACYRVVPRGDEVYSMAQEEMHALMDEMGVADPPSIEQAVEALAQAGIDLAPTDRVKNYLADLAVLLVDNGFFFLGNRCVYQMWHMRGSDELSMVSKSLSA